MKRLLCILFTLLLTACHYSKNDNDNFVRVGTIAGPETQLMQVAQKVALQKFKLHINIVQFTDYNTPNQALEDDEIDANAFQHYPFLLAQIRERGYALASVGDTFLYPMGLYSRTIKSLPALKP